VNYQVCSIAKFLDKNLSENWWQRHMSKNRKKVNFLGEEKTFSKGHGHGKNHENHVPVPFLAGFQNHVPVPFLGWFPKPVPVARALFAPKWACRRALGPCPYTPDAMT
jgi:hypothetical protein